MAPGLGATVWPLPAAAGASCRKPGSRLTVLVTVVGEQGKFQVEGRPTSTSILSPDTAAHRFRQPATHIQSNARTRLVPRIRPTHEWFEHALFVPWHDAGSGVEDRDTGTRGCRA